MKTHTVSIVVPVYRVDMTEYERISMERLVKVLGSHRIVVVKPVSLDLSPLSEKYPCLEFESFDDGCFESISSYNRLMMSEAFYRRFQDSEYILIYQLDAYVFRDELDYWCAKGYDYIGAPWLLRPVYKFPLFRFTSWLKKKYCDVTHRPNGQITRYKVGNGGFSLRKVDSMLRAVTELRQVVERFLTAKHHHTFNEDVFFGVEVNNHGLGFRYPDWREALRFSFDKYPKLCYELNDGRLPFGCHSWYKRKMKKFWFPLILKN